MEALGGRGAAKSSQNVFLMVDVTLGALHAVQ